MEARAHHNKYMSKIKFLLYIKTTKSQLLMSTWLSVIAKFERLIKKMTQGELQLET